jgi:hypothetical protein
LPAARPTGRFSDGEPVHRHQFQHRSFALREGLQLLVQLPDLPESVDFLRQTIDVIGVQQTAARNQALSAAFPHGPAELSSDDVARDPVQPRPRATERSPVLRRRIDHREEHLRGQVSGQLRVRHPARHEPGHLIHMRTVELAERGGIGPIDRTGGSARAPISDPFDDCDTSKWPAAAKALPGQVNEHKRCRHGQRHTASANPTA